eukprot:TRINITY_DN1220_c0_g1_i1.p1 TRINITY_DN1220_c0_g1~~TRINITY_DN1220_c0_g1_i1.p1  ORF type:complete len:619 (+),score=151.36 TRINITY_DN1220_c0_g1_i1:237-2093(+)
MELPVACRRGTGNSPDSDGQPEAATQSLSDPPEVQSVDLASFLGRQTRRSLGSTSMGNVATDSSLGTQVSPMDQDDGTQSGTPRRRSFDTRSFMSERVNVQISARYDIDNREIGVGGYGKVYIAKDRMFKDRLVAIKKVVKINEDKTAEFKGEVEIMKDLDHPNICRLFETYDLHRHMFLVIEYLEGGDLFDKLSDSETGRICENEAAQIIKQVSSALKYAHSHGIAHRDLKLENICFCSREPDPEMLHVKVIDWGLGKYFGKGRMKSNVGTGMYSAPEVLKANQSEGYTHACDIWSLGVVTYVTLCGKPPFWGSPEETLQRMRDERYPMHNGVWVATSEPAKDFIRKLLKADPTKRLAMEEILHHSWIAKSVPQMDIKVVAEVLTNLEQFSHAPDFFSICVASVARQLDHTHLRNVQSVFCELDTNSDGVLDLAEMRVGFQTVFGENMTVQEVDDIFSRLDLDDTGQITYTEFSAAGIGQDGYEQEHVLWAAFKTFDIRDDGRISKAELQEVLTNADVNRVWSTQICEDVANVAMEEFGGDDGTINFEEWLRLMRGFSAKQGPVSPRRLSELDAKQHSLRELKDLKPVLSQPSSSPSAAWSSCWAGLCHAHPSCVVQ